SYRDYASNDLEAFLNQCMSNLNSLPDSHLNELQNRFKRAMVESYRIFGDRAFRKVKRGSNKRLPINRALFEVWAQNIEALSPNEVERLVANNKALKERFVSLLEDPEFAGAISYGTGDPKKVRLRFSKIEDIVRETLNDS